jgi:hypothetical protein
MQLPIAANGAVDLGNSASWPIETVELVSDITSEIASWPQVESDTAPSDLDVYSCYQDSLPDDWSSLVENELRQTLKGRMVLAYHASRLLPHEIQWVLEEGMMRLSWDLVERKLKSASEHYSNRLDDSGVQLLLKSGPLIWQNTSASRIGFIHMVSPFSSFESFWGFGNLLLRWGGEVISWTDDDRTSDRPAGEIIDAMSEVSSAAIVEMKIPVEQIPRTRVLWAVLAGTNLNLDRVQTEWRIETDVPPANIVTVLTSVDERWPPELKKRKIL